MVSMFLGCCLAAGFVTASGTGLWVVDKSEDFLKGKGEGVAVTDDGRLIWVGRWQSATTVEEPVVMAGAVLADGSVVIGTGHPARLYKLQGDQLQLLAEVEEEQITAIHATSDGDLLVATMAPGVLYRWRKGELQEIGRLGTGGIWDLDEIDGVVVAAAGPPASLYRVTERGFERWVELPDTHARCLLAVDQSLLIGTSGKGLILGIQGTGQVALLADSPFTEISALAAAGDGSVWATALVGEPTPPPQPAQRAQGNSSEASTETSAVDLTLPKVNGATATSEVLRLTPEGALLKIHRFTKQVATALAWDGEGVLVGTGYDGEVWRFTAEGGARLATVDGVQVVGFLGGGSHLLTQGPAQILRRDPQDQEPGRFRVQAEKLSLPVHLGEYRIDPPSDQLKIRFRSGASDQPDDTWLPWTEWLPGSGGKVTLPPARSLQWEIEIPNQLGVAGVERVELAFRQVNLPPQLKEITVEDPGVVFLGGPPPSGPVIDVDHPDFSGIFSVVDGNGRSANNKPVQGKKYWRVGFRTVTWKGQDPNQDLLRYSVELERRDQFLLPVRKHLETTRLAVDSTAVPDGWYRFRITATDELQNPAWPQQSTGLSEWFRVDNTAPEVKVERRGQEWQVSVSDAMSPLVRVEWSRDGNRWQGLAPADGVLDGLAESFTFAAESGRHLVVVRAFDRHHNRTSVGTVEE
jgi:hypothetical protein